MSSKRERQQRRQEELRQQQAALAQRPERLAEIERQQRQSRLRLKLGVYGGISLVVIVLAIFFINDRIVAAQPGKYDSFAKCLTEKGAVMYGAIEWCEYTQAQAKMFGNSFKYVDYRHYRELPGITKTPTWVINGSRYERVQSFEKLSALTGCKIEGE